MKKRHRIKAEKKAELQIEVILEGVDGLNELRQLSDPRLVIRKGAKVLVRGAPKVVDGIRIFPVRVRVGKRCMQKCWLDEDALHSVQLLKCLEKLGIRIKE